MEKNSPFILIIIMFLFLSTNGVLVEASSYEYDIGVSHDTALFNLSNLKPGDQVSKKLTVQNRGWRDFTYYTEANFKGGSKALYNQFRLKVSDSDRVLFHGYLKDFTSIEPRFLKAGSEEDLKFEVLFPPELGNKYQGKWFKYEIKFMVKGYGDQTPDPPGPEDPKPPNPEPPEPTKPEDPPKEPEPEDPNPSDNDDEELKPQRPIPKDKLRGPIEEGHILPKTSTNIFNYFLLGITSIFIGASIIIWRKLWKSLSE